MKCSLELKRVCHFKPTSLFLHPMEPFVFSSVNSGTEVVKLEFDPEIISYEDILNIFFKIHDPTTLNSQGPDFGTQYRSEIFYDNENQKIVAEKILNQINEKLSGRVVTKISKIHNYCKAEEYHQKYLEKN